MLLLVILLLFSCLLLFQGGWDRLLLKKGSVVGPKDAVAQFGLEAIRENDLRWYLESRGSFVGGLDEQKIKKRVQEMVKVKILAQEARRLGMDKDSAMSYSIDQMLGFRLLEENVLWPVNARVIDQKEIEQYYTEHIKEFVRPRQIRLAGIFIAVRKGTSNSECKNKLLLAQKVLSEAIEVEKKRFGITRLIKQYSDSHPAYTQGDTGYFDEEGRSQGIPPALVTAAFSLKVKGKVFNELIETPEGYHIVMLVGDRPKQKREQSDVAAQIEQRIRRDEIASKREHYINSLLQKTPPEFVDHQIEAIVEEYRLTVEKQKISKGNGSGPPLIRKNNSGS